MPGYPVFIAAIWLLFGDNITAPLLAQSVIYTIALDAVVDQLKVLMRRAKGA